MQPRVPLTCREVLLLCSRSLDERLPLPHRLALRMHLLLCRTCAGTFRCMRAFHTLVAVLGSRLDTLPHEREHHLDDAVKRRMAAALERAAAPPH